MTDRLGLAVLGGDERQIAMARALADAGYPVWVWGLGACEDRIGTARVCVDWQKAVEAASAVILPLPASADGVRIHCPLQDPEIFLRITALLDFMRGRLLLGGRLGETMRSIAEQSRSSGSITMTARFCN